MERNDLIRLNRTLAELNSRITIFTRAINEATEKVGKLSSLITGIENDNGEELQGRPEDRSEQPGT